MSEKILILGITGQLGSTLTEYYLNKNPLNKVYGVKRRSSNLNTQRIDHLYTDLHADNRLELFYGDVTDFASLSDVISQTQPDILINAAAQSHVAVSFKTPIDTAKITGLGVLNVLEAVRKFSPKTRVIQCSSSEMFGSAPAIQHEATQFQPCSPYAVAKIFGYHMVNNYKESYNLHLSNAIMFNYEGPNRGETFVTRKITRFCTRYVEGLESKLYLGSTSPKRDWCSIDDICLGLDLMAHADSPDNYCLATGVSHTVEQFLEKVCQKLNINYHDFLEFDPRYTRPAEVVHLQGSFEKINKKLGWEPKRDLDMIIEDMVNSDLKLAKKERILKENNV